MFWTFTHFSHLQSSCRFQLNGGSLSSHSLCWCCPFAPSASFSSTTRNTLQNRLLCRCSMCFEVHACVCLCVCVFDSVYVFVFCLPVVFPFSLSHSPSFSLLSFTLLLTLTTLQSQLPKANYLDFLFLFSLQVCSPVQECNSYWFYIFNPIIIFFQITHLQTHQLVYGNRQSSLSKLWHWTPFQCDGKLVCCFCQFFRLEYIFFKQ